MCWGVEKCRKRCGESVLGFPILPHISFHLPYTPTHFPTPPPTLSHTSPNTFFHTPTYFPTSFPTLLPALSHTSPNTSPHTPSPLTSPTLQHTSLHLSPQLLLPLPHLPLPSPHSNTLFYTSPNTSLHISLRSSHASQHPPHSILTAYFIPHFKKIMLKCFYIRFKPEKYVGTIAPMPPVKECKKKLNPICQQRVAIFS